MPEPGRRRLLGSDQLMLSRITLDIPSLALLLKPDDLVTGSDMARELGIKQEVAYHLVNQNLIASIDLGSAGRFIRQLDVVAFSDGFMCAQDLSKRLRTSSRWLEARLRVFAIAPVSGPGVDEGRQLLYRWTYIFEGFKKVLEI